MGVSTLGLARSTISARIGHKPRALCASAQGMWVYLDQQLESRHLGDCVCQVLEQVATIHSMDVMVSPGGW